MVAEVLQVIDGQQIVELFLNNKDKIYLGEVTDDPAGFSMVISRDDWPLIKKFIDDQFLPF